MAAKVLDLGAGGNGHSRFQLNVHLEGRQKGGTHLVRLTLTTLFLKYDCLDKRPCFFVPRHLLSLCPMVCVKESRLSWALLQCRSLPPRLSSTRTALPKWPITYRSPTHTITPSLMRPGLPMLRNLSLGYPFQAVLQQPDSQQRAERSRKHDAKARLRCDMAAVRVSTSNPDPSGSSNPSRTAMMPATCSIHLHHARPPAYQHDSQYFLSYGDQSSPRIGWDVPPGVRRSGPPDAAP